MTSAAGWSAGYVTDTAYMRGYYHEQSPLQLALAALLMGVQTDLPGPSDEVSYLELGCGQGFGATVLAAANPGWRITAVDFNPAHIAAARRGAAELGLANIRFLEADLASLPEDPLMAEVPQADVASLHGVWSWVSPEVRAGIVRLLRARVKPGGLVHVSYNALPGWQGALLLQRLVREAGRRLAHGSIEQARAGLGLVHELMAAEAAGLAKAPRVTDILRRLEQAAPDYLAHEYMNSSWAPCWHADVAADLAAAKLDYIGSARLLSNFDDLMLTDAQRAIANRFADPLMRELVVDACNEPTLRHDIYVRGTRRLSTGARDAALEAVTLALPMPPEEMVYAVNVPAGRASLSEAYYHPMIEHLAERPCTVGELLSLPALAGHARNPAEVVGMLVGSGQALVLARPGAPMNNVSRHLNALTRARELKPDTMRRVSAMACPALAGGLPTALAHFYVAERFAAAGGIDATDFDTEIWARQLAPADTPAEDIAALAKQMADEVRRRGKIWRWLGIA
ncbi:MAG: class I SAM-dependent methyltransferase [Rhodospirillales bacterium]|nr:class I SAM-dependent methyltransferase [Rhodospirillales bacterium]